MCMHSVRNIAFDKIGADLALHNLRSREYPSIPRHACALICYFLILLLVKGKGGEIVEIAFFKISRVYMSFI